MISRERARTTGLTAAAGVLMLAVAFVMMIVAAPGHGHVQAQPGQVLRRAAHDRRVPSAHVKGDSPAVRACQAVRPPWAALLAELTGPVPGLYDGRESDQLKEA